MQCCSQCSQPCSRPPSTHTSAGNSWTLTGKSGSVSCGVTALLSWVLVHKVLFVPFKSLFPQSCVSSGGSMVGLMVTSSKRAYATHYMTEVCCSQSPCPQSRPLLTHASTGDTQTLKGRSGSVSVGSLVPGVHKVLFEPYEHPWWIRGLILNVISPSYCFSVSYPLPLDVGYLFLVGSNILL